MAAPSTNGVILSKRARELQQSEGTFISNNSSNNNQLFTTSSSDAPMSLSELHESFSMPLGSIRPNNNRPRAGTLPSTFLLSPATNPTNSPLNRHHGSTQIGTSSLSLPTSGSATPDYPFLTPVTLTPTHLLPSSSAASSTSASSRLRSGSLGIPSSASTPGLSSAFGPNVWNGGSSGWGSAGPTGLSQSSIPTARRGTVSGTSSSTFDESRSRDSSAYGDDSHVRTLDYLGLEGDNPVGFGPFESDGSNIGRERASSTLVTNSTGFRSMSDAFLAQQNGRMRSNTVATFPRSTVESAFSRSAGVTPPPPSTGYPSSALSNRYPEESRTEQEFYNADRASPSRPASYHRSSESTDSSRLLYSSAIPPAENSTSPFSPGSPSRARAATIGILDESREVFLRRRAGTTAAGIEITGDYSGGNVNALNRRMRGLSFGQEDAAPVWNSASRPITPDLVALSHTPSPQLPTRSLWIGNLDPSTTLSELQAVFAPYGPIESFRLIPEKECGFVNFFSIADAIHAKEDVYSRLGGNLNGNIAGVRIGFGKSDSSSPIIAGTGSGSGPHSRTPTNGTSGLGLGGSPDPSMPQQISPTRALWIGSIPTSTTPGHLMTLFAPFGPIESARVLTHKSCGFINFERTEDAINARQALSGREILGAEIGTIRIGFAKVPSKVVNPAFAVNSFSPQLSQGYNDAGFTAPQNGMNGDANGNTSRRNEFNEVGSFPGSAGETDRTEEQGRVETVIGSLSEIQALMRELGEADPAEVEKDVARLAEARTPVTYFSSFPAASQIDPAIARRYANADAPRLREIRKQLDGTLTTAEVDDIAESLLEECVPLASDYIGNTLIQKLFEQASETTRMSLLTRIAPHMAQIGIHKNGTWAVQKIIQSIQTPEEHEIVRINLQPYTPALLLNDFGNYVVQGTLRFGSPTTDFIFDAMVDRCWEIGSGRFGARSTRQTLESPLASPYQVKRVAIAILLNIIPLATSTNGALLVTWLLDSSELSGRYGLLAARFLPHLARLLTHKLASLAVIKIINQRVDPAASRLILDSLFSTDSLLLEEILTDQTQGGNSLTKIVNSTFVDSTERLMMSERVRTALGALRVQSAPTYHKLVEEMGMQPPPQPMGQYPQYSQGGPWQQQPPQQQYPSYPQYPMAYPQFPQQYPNQQQQGFPYYPPPQLNYYHHPYAQQQPFSPQSRAASNPGPPGVPSPTFQPRSSK